METVELGCFPEDLEEPFFPRETQELVLAPVPDNVESENARGYTVTVQAAILSMRISDNNGNKRYACFGLAADAYGFN